MSEVAAPAASPVRVEELNTATRAHHPDSPSSLQASEACPLFENEQRNSAAADKGTLQHKATETRDLSLLDADEAMEGAVTRCIEYEDACIEAYKNFEAAAYGRYFVIREKYLIVGDDEITGGFPDTIVLNSRTADVLDWKFGRIPVTSTKDNLQGMAYALGVFQEWPTLQEVTVHFFAPYQGWSEEEHNSKYVHTFYRKDVPELELRVRTVIARKKDPGSVASPRTDLCLWCAKKGDCKALHAVILRGAEKHPDFIVPEVVDAVTLSRPQQVKQAFLWASQVEFIAKAIKKRATEMVLTEGLELGDDMKLVRRVERRIVSNKALLEIAEQFGVPSEQVTELLTVPITKIEDAVKALAPRGKGAAKLREFAAALKEGGVIEDGTPIYFLQEAKAPAEKQKPILEISA